MTPEQAKVKAEATAKSIWSDLTGRSGFDLDVDHDTKDEIRKAWSDIITAALLATNPAEGCVTLHDGREVRPFGTFSYSTDTAETTRCEEGA